MTGILRSWRAAALVLAALAPLGAGADAPDYQIHGFAAQGFALSDGNNVIGDSTHGNFQYYEIGVNGTVQTDYHLLFSAQELVRKSGSLDDGDLRLDYGFVDFQAVTGASVDAGVRAGRVKNPFGLFNETRDVVFTRPGILLPLSVYFDTSGVRSLLFSSNGGQLYGGWSHGRQYTSLVVTRALDYTLTEDDKRVFGGGGFPLTGDLRLNDFVVGRLMNDWNAGIFRLAASYANGTLKYAPGPADPFPAFSLDIDLYLLSARYNAERYSLTGEYVYTRSRSMFGDGDSDGFYLQGDYRLMPHWSAMARFDASFTDRSDRSGDHCTDSTGAPVDRHQCFTLGSGVGLNWQPDEHWGVWGEFHMFDGNSVVPGIENVGRPRDPHWNLLLLMAAYRF